VAGAEEAAAYEELRAQLVEEHPRHLPLLLERVRRLAKLEGDARDAAALQVRRACTALRWPAVSLSLSLSRSRSLSLSLSLSVSLSLCLSVSLSVWRSSAGRRRTSGEPCGLARAQRAIYSLVLRR